MTLQYPLRLVRSVTLILSLFIIMVFCKPPRQTNNETATSPFDTIRAADSCVSTPVAELSVAGVSAASEYTPPEIHEVIDYPNHWRTINDPPHAFGPFAELKAIVSNFINDKDSLRAVGGDAFANRETATHRAIMDYKREIESGKYSQSTGGALFDFPRIAGANDSSSLFLPDIRPSYFTDGEFFFLGGAPFIQSRIDYDTITHQEIIYKDGSGRPELRLSVKSTENEYHLLKSIMQFRRPRLKIGFGGPVGTYDGPPDEVKGIGSIIHSFVDEIPVFYLMESGVVRGRLKYYEAPFIEHSPCYSDYPHLIFSCSADISPDEIIGIYIPYDDQLPTVCSVSRPDKWGWRADLNNDNVPDIACVIGTYEGGEPDVLEMLWFINLNGTWKIVDYGQVLSCT